MKPLPTAATYVAGSFILYAFTGWTWIPILGTVLAASAIARHLYNKGQ